MLKFQRAVIFDVNEKNCLWEAVASYAMVESLTQAGRASNNQNGCSFRKSSCWSKISSLIVACCTGVPASAGILIAIQAVACKFSSIYLLVVEGS